MATADQRVEQQEIPLEKGLKSGALGLISSTVIATASVAAHIGASMRIAPTKVLFVVSYSGASSHLTDFMGASLCLARS